MRALCKIVLPIATTWANQQEARMLRTGIPLTPAQLADAAAIGIAHPERVRLDIGPEAPWPFLKMFRPLAVRTGLVPRQIAGVTFRYGIFLRANHQHERGLLLHELAHTAQYERLGGIRGFLAEYLYECLSSGYPNGPLEQEASTMARAMINVVSSIPEGCKEISRR